MQDLLQRLWNEYSLLVKQINNAVDDVDLSAEMQALNDSIIDTPEMEALRAELKAAGVNF